VIFYADFPIIFVGAILPYLSNIHKKYVPFMYEYSKNVYLFIAVYIWEYPMLPQSHCFVNSY